MSEQIGQPNPDQQPEQEPNNLRLLSPVAGRLVHEARSELDQSFKYWLDGHDFCKLAKDFISSDSSEMAFYNNSFTRFVTGMREYNKHEIMKTDVGVKWLSMTNELTGRWNLSPGLIFLRIAEILVAGGHAKWVVANIDRFPPEAHQNIFLLLPPDSYSEMFRPEVVSGTARFPQLIKKSILFRGLGARAAKKLENDRRARGDLGGGYLGPDTTMTTREEWIARERAAQAVASVLFDFARKGEKSLIGLVQPSPEKRHVITRLNNIEIALDSQGQLRISNLIPVAVFPKLAPKYSHPLDQRELLVRELCIAFSVEELNQLSAIFSGSGSAEMSAASPPEGRGTELGSV